METIIISPGKSGVIVRRINDDDCTINSYQFDDLDTACKYLYVEYSLNAEQRDKVYARIKEQININQFRDDTSS